MEKLAHWCFRRRWIVVLSWVVLVVAINGLSFASKPDFNDDFKLPDTESKTATDLIVREFPQASGESVKVVVHTKQGTVDEPAVRESVDKMLAEIRKLNHVQSVSSFYDEGGMPKVSQDRTIAYADVQLDITADKIQLDDVESYVDTAKKYESEQLQVELGGNVISYVNSGDPPASELLAVVAAAVILFIAFGSIFTMFTPIITALVGIMAAGGVIGLLTHTLSIAEFAPVLAVLIGLGVGIDYSLFIVSRHRNNLRTGHTPEESIVVAITTSGRAVVFAGLTVCVALAGLFLVGVSFLYGAALAAIAAVLFTMMAAITLLPALLGFIGMKALNRKERRRLAADGPESHEEISTNWFRWARFVERRSVVTGVAAMILMLLIASPFLSIDIGAADQGNDRKGTTTRAAYDLMAKGFGAGFNGDIVIAATLTADGDLNELMNMRDAIEILPGVAAAVGPIESDNGKVALIRVTPTTSPQSEDTSELIERLRKQTIPYSEGRSQSQMYVGGTTAIFDDFTEVLASKLPLFIGSVVLVAGLLLVLLFRSLIIPLTASLMNLLSAAAAFGVVVAIFQWGWLSDVFGIDTTGPIDAFLPIMLFSILFGLSMDYEVFLVSRMHEEWVRTGNNDEAISLGQAETGRVITAAAAIMVFVFGSFVLTDDRVIKLFGIGLASAIFLDALIVRTILVPSVMHWFGKWNWWLPSWLDKALPRVSVEAPTHPATSRQD